VSAIQLKCHCGKVSGTVKNVSPKYGTRVICHCLDCQAFARYLGTENRILDDHGGTDIYQTNPAQLDFETGTNLLRCLQLKAGGTIRWYTECCQTAIGNTISAKVPFIGLIHSIMADNYEVEMGPALYRVQTQSADPPLAATYQNVGFPKPLMRRAMRKMLLWKITGKNRPNPFFDKSGQTRSQIVIVHQS